MNDPNNKQESLSHHDVLVKVNSFLKIIGSDLDDIPNELKDEAKKHWNYPSHQKQYQSDAQLVSIMADSMIEKCEKSTYTGKQYKALLIALKQKVVNGHWV